MKILAVSARIPERGKKGDQVLSFYRLTYLAKHHQIHLICFGCLKANKLAVERLEAVGVRVHLVKWKRFITGLNILKVFMFSNIPIQCAFFISKEFQQKFTELLKTFQPDIVYSVTVRIFENISHSSAPVVIDLVDSMGLNFHRRLSNERGIRRQLINLEYERIKRYEKITVEHSNQSFVVSAIDQQFISSKKIYTLPLGVDSEEFSRQDDAITSEPVIVFTGNMNYRPNIEAVLWFYDNCFFKIKSTISNVKWIIAGRSPPKEILSLAQDPAILVPGYVKSITSILNSAQVSIAPLQSGSGMQFKILEAMSCNVSVVTTSLGLGDIKAKNGEELVVEDSPELFAKAVISLLTNNVLRKKIGDAGLLFVRNNHSWNALNLRFEQLIQANLFN